MDPRIARAVAFIEAHIHEPMTVPQIAAHVSLSVSQLTRLFRRDTGTTPTAYLHQMRMQLARALIERTSLSVTEVMRQVGIADPSHFARDFRRAHGLSPRLFREQHRTGEYAADCVSST
jgi:transcriptional regulator GlxA family with amidase domain